MRRKNFMVIVLVVAMVGLGLWWFTWPTAAVPEKMATTPMPAKAAAPALSKVEAPKSVAPPTIAPPASNPIASQRLPVSVPDTSADPQANLKTAFADIARLIRAGDTATFRETYDPPGKLDPQQIQQMRVKQQQTAALAAQNPQLQQILQKMNEAIAQSFEAHEYQTPTYNDAGDEATYMYTVPGYQEQPTPRVFVKINGKWYLKLAALPDSGGASTFR